MSSCHPDMQCLGLNLESAPPVRVLLVDTIEELQETLAHIPGDGAHHAEVVVDEPTFLLCIHGDIARVRICSQGTILLVYSFLFAVASPSEQRQDHHGM